MKHYLAPLLMSPALWFVCFIIILAIIWGILPIKIRDIVKLIGQIIGLIVAAVFVVFLIYVLGMIICERFELFGW